MSASARPGDQTRVTVSVAVPPEEAFRVFTEEIDLWWRRGRRFRNAPGDRGLVALEPGVGGRVFESFATEAGETVVEIGRTRVWQPPERLVFEWRAANFAAHESTEVEVSFEPTPTGTQVTVVHRGWSALRADHPVRHGLDSPAFVRMMGMWWGDLLTSLRLRAAKNRPPAG
jgi:uncharacterized protein YndB with AHSA1/START domain